MKKLLSLIVIEILTTLVIYGICAFITWDFNPFGWGVTLRVIASLLWGLGTVLITGEFIDKITKKQ